MDRIIYTAMTGANALMHRQQAIAHNLANVSTNGFRAEMSTYRSVPLRGEGASTRVFALDATAGHLDQPGSMQSTGRNLDIAARGNAYFAIQALDGRESYTRAGALQVSPVQKARPTDTQAPWVALRTAKSERMSTGSGRASR